MKSNLKCFLIICVLQNIFKQIVYKMEKKIACSIHKQRENSMKYHYTTLCTIIIITYLNTLAEDFFFFIWIQNAWIECLCVYNKVKMCAWINIDLYNEMKICFYSLI